MIFAAKVVIFLFMFKLVKKMWEHHQKFVKKMWEHYQKIVKKMWEFHQKIVKKMWEYLRKLFIYNTKARPTSNRNAGWAFC